MDLILLQILYVIQGNSHFPRCEDVALHKSLMDDSGEAVNPE